LSYSNSAYQFAQLAPIQLNVGKRVYFASDFHFGIPNAATSNKREALVCQWLDAISKDAQLIIIQGDIFDAWLEYNTVVPKGTVRFLGKLAQLRDAGITIIAFTGNHDLWMYGYFEQELDIPVYHNPITVSINNVKFVLGHGDGLGPGDAGYKRLKYFLNHPICKWVYKWLHPDIGMPIANYFSGRGVYKKQEQEQYLGDDKEYLVQFCKDYLLHQEAHYFIFGHRHYMKQLSLTPASTYINLGDWLHYNSYAVFDGTQVLLLQWPVQ
jgi:UDP-2,3-diacylglucosamine hydrolase